MSTKMTSKLFAIPTIYIYIYYKKKNNQGTHILVQNQILLKVPLRSSFDTVLDSFIVIRSECNNEWFEDIKWVISICKSKDRQHNGKKKRIKRQITIHKTLHKRSSKRNNPTKNRGWAQLLREGKQFSKRPY